MGHALAEAAIFEEVLFEAKNLSIEEIGCDLDKSNDDVGTDGRIIILNPFFEGFSRVFLASNLSPRHGLGMRCYFLNPKKELIAGRFDNVWGEHMLIDIASLFVPEESKI